MKSNKKALLGILALAIVFNAATIEAKEVPQGKVSDTKIPIVVEADKIYFSDSSGNMQAQGNVIIIRNTDKLLAELIEGNTKQSEVWINGQGTIIQPELKLDGSSIRYNYQARTGSILKAAGKVGKEFVTGRGINIQPDKVIIHDGTMTKCPAKTPDYHISAEKVEIWPDDKIIAHNVKYWIKDKVIFSMSKYQKSLEKDDESDFPRIGYSSDNGFYIQQKLTYPVAANQSVFTDLAYYTKEGFKPAYGFQGERSNFKYSIIGGYYQDADDYWIKKEGEFRLNTGKRIGNSPISYSLSASAGKWTGIATLSGVEETSWHQEYRLWLSHDPIKLGDGINLNLGTGFQITKESADDSTTDSMIFYAGLNKKWSSKLSTWASYYYSSDTADYFRYGGISTSKELRYGLSYKLDRLDAISVSQLYNMDLNKVTERYYTWNRNLHCWDLSITYKAEGNNDHKLQFKVSTAKW